MLRVEFKLNVEALTANIDGIARKQIPFATAKALTTTAKQAEAEVVATMSRVFDRPTPYTLRSTYVKPATKATLQAEVGIKAFAGKGTPPARFLEAEIIGGGRHWKSFERSLQRAGAMPTGWYARPPAQSSWAVQLDAYGNIPSSLIVKLLSYFQAFPEQGFRANMTARSKRRLAKRGKTADGYERINGVEYFVSMGKGTTYGRLANSRYTQHLAAGIWAKRGTHGSDVAPVMIYTRTASYKVRFPFGAIVTRVATANFDRNFAQAYLEAAETAR